MRKGLKVTLIVVLSVIVAIVVISVLFNKLTTRYRDGIYTFDCPSGGKSYTLTVKADSQTEVEIPTEGHRGYPVKTVFIYGDALRKVSIPDGITYVRIDAIKTLKIIELPSSVTYFYLDSDLTAYEDLQTITYDGTTEAFKAMYPSYNKLPRGVKIICADGTIYVEGETEE